MMKSKKGFTLSELMLAAAILAIVLSGLFQLLIVSIMSNVSSSNLVLAANDAQYVLEAIKGLTYTNITSGDCGTQPGLCPTLVMPNEYISWTSVDESALKLVTVEVSWDERNGTKNFQLSTRIAQTTQ